MKRARKVVRCNHCLEMRDWLMVNLGGLNLVEGGAEGKNWGVCGSGSTKPPILGDGRSNVAVLLCIEVGSGSEV